MNPPRWWPTYRWNFIAGLWWIWRNSRVLVAAAEQAEARASSLAIGFAEATAQVEQAEVTITTLRQRVGVLEQHVTDLTEYGGQEANDWMAFKQRIAALEQERDGNQLSTELHADLNRRVAKALGLPFGATWHDLPEQVAQVIADATRHAEARRQLAEAVRGRIQSWRDFALVINAPASVKGTIQGFVSELEAALAAAEQGESAPPPVK